MLLEKKRLLITGVLTRQSIAFHVAKTVQEQGGEVVLTGFGKGLSLTERTARNLPERPDVYEMDVSDLEQIDAVGRAISDGWGRLDGFLHAIAFAPQDALGGNFLNTPWDSAATALRVSAFSLKDMAQRLRPLMNGGGSIVSMDFDASVAWPVYDWMGVSKAALESVTRYLARDLGPDGIRVNCLSAGPIRTMAAKGIPGFDQLASGWSSRAPLGWDMNDPVPVAHVAAFLLSDWSSGITGEIVHVDGGYHAIGAALGEKPADGAPSEGGD